MESELFNLYEGIFWITLGLLVLGLVMFRKVPGTFLKLAKFSSVVLVLFGLSDLIQVKVGSFFQSGLTWLLVWKVMCVVGLLTMVVWYFILRLKSD